MGYLTIAVIKFYLIIYNRPNLLVDQVIQAGNFLSLWFDFKLEPVFDTVSKKNAQYKNGQK